VRAIFTCETVGVFQVTGCTALRPPTTAGERQFQDRTAIPERHQTGARPPQSQAPREL